MIVDFHTHTFPAKISAGVLEKLSKASLTKYYTDGSAEGLHKSMSEVGIDYSVNLPVMTDAGQVEKVNSSLIASREKLFAQGIITFGGMHPDYENYRAELRRLKENGIAGIKIHPAYQRTDIDDIRMMNIIDCASELDLIVVAHAGIDIGIYERNYASVKQIINVIDRVKPSKLVLAHMGNWACWDEVESDLAGAPVWLDTAFSIGRIERLGEGENPYLSYFLGDEDFIRIVRKHGADKILFATDSPWKDQKDYVERINKMQLSDEEKNMIFYENSSKLLNLKTLNRL